MKINCRGDYQSPVGISLISLIITIIVIIILAVIVIFTGLSTPDRANFAKFTSEFSDFQTAVEQDYYNRYQKHALANDTRSKAQIYLEIASNGAYNGMEIKTSEGAVSQPPLSEINAMLATSGLKGIEYYQITSDTNVTEWKKQINYYAPTEKHYVTDEGEVFMLPGYLVEENGEEKWYINSSKYYIGKQITGGNAIIAEGALNLEQLQSQIGSFVEYGVTYTDVYSPEDNEYTYTEKNGWRLLSAKSGDTEGRYNIEIISTGIPAKLNYVHNANMPWAGDGVRYSGDYYVTNDGNTGNNNMKAAAGLRYNFESIVFTGNSTDASNNEGCYKMINGRTDKTNGSIFRASLPHGKVEEVRSVMHSDITGVKDEDITSIGTELAPGLFKLNQISSKIPGYTYDSSTNAWYWLASPDAGNTYALRYVFYNGSVNSNSYDYTLGVRPVVSISGVQLVPEDGILVLR